ncbi:MAG: NnrU family protein [Sulfurifustaceae bacterium]
MDPIAHLGLATAAFLLTHFVSSTPLRATLVARLGQRAYLGLYVVVAFITLGWMIAAYRHAPRELLWIGWRHVPLLVMPFALILLATGIRTRNPTAVMQESQLRSPEPARGVLRITRHPLMWAIALWAAVHVLARGDMKSLIFFGGLLLLALMGTVLIDRRKAALGTDWHRFTAVTSNVPFVAIAQGRNRFAPGEIGYRLPLIGLVLFAVVFILHPYIFGARPY